MWLEDRVTNLPLRWLTGPCRLMFCLVLFATFCLNGAAPLAADPTVIASDDFESNSYSGGAGWATNWNASTAAAIVAGEHPYSGVRHLEMRGSAIASRVVDLTGWTDVELGFRARARSLESGDFVTAEVSPDGRAWQVLETWGDGDDNNEYHLYEYDLSGMTRSDTFFLRFLSRMDEPSDYFYLDDVLIQGEPVPADVITTPVITSLSTENAGWLPVSPVVLTLSTTSGAGIVVNGSFSDWAGYPNLTDPAGDASKARGDLSAFYWGNNDDEVNYWMIERYPASSNDEEDDEGEENEGNEGYGPGNSLVKKVKYIIYIDTNNNGDFTGQGDRRVLVDYHPNANHSDVRVKVKTGGGGQTLYSAEGDWGESAAEGGRRVEVAASWSDLGISSGDVIRMYLESDRHDRVPNSGDIQWSPASILGFWLLATAMAVGGVALWHIHKRRDAACRSGSE